MQLASVLLARAVVHVELFDLDPKGEVYFPKIVQALIERFKFQKYPQKYEELDAGKGMEFLGGIIDDVVVHNLTMFTNGLSLDTRSSTDDSERIINEILLWGVSTFGLKYKPGMINRKYYVSQLTFYSESSLLEAISSPLAKLANRVTASLAKVLMDEPPSYDLGAIALSHDHLKRKYPLAPFNITRRVETPFTQNKYFSEAPLPTRLHETLLREFEADLLASKR